MGLFTGLQKELKNYLSAEQIKEIEKAFLLAKDAHEGQTRQTGEPYVTHPLAVARILADMRLDPQSIKAAILHDVIEDTGVDKATLRKHFGDEVAELVDGVSKLAQIKFETRAEAQAENFRKMVLAMVRDIRVILVKLADRLHNMRTIGALPVERKRRIALETLEIYAPIANRLGMHHFYVEFEDLGFAAYYPLRYRIIRNAVKKSRGNRKEIISLIEKGIKGQLKKATLKTISITGREKHLYSIYKKMKDRHVPFNEIMDVYGVRIIVEELDMCYRILGSMHNLYKPVPDRFKDYIAIPKANGYQSLHTSLFGPYGVPIELQIRTIDMDHTAENGISAHWLYKSQDNIAYDTHYRAREWVKNLKEIQEQMGSSLEFMESVKVDLFPEEVYVFTPAGEIMELPKGATPIDFAYAVHTDIGNSCVSAKVNRRLAPLSLSLVNGQTVEIITSKTARPNPAWLNFVTTGKARSSIRHYLKSQRRVESIALGQELIEQALTALPFSWDKLNEEQLAQLLKVLNYSDSDDLFEAIGLGTQMALIVVGHLADIVEESESIPVTLSLDKPLLIKGSGGMVVRFAECCRPIPGDPILGLLEKGYGLIVHIESCEMLDPYRGQSDNCVPVRWEEDIKGDFSIDIQVEVRNERGVLATLANTISDCEANIENIRVDLQDGRYNTVYLTLTVKNRVHLAKVMRRIRSVKQVVRLVRKK